jgi:hypothetical protein
MGLGRSRRDAERRDNLQAHHHHGGYAHVGGHT